MNRKTIVIGDNDLKFSESLAKHLLNEGFTVFHERDGDSTYSRVLDETPGLVVLDLSLPGLDGFNLCKKIRPIIEGLILFLASQDNELDQILAFELGADDFVVKPVRLRVLTARINALLRRVFPFELKGQVRTIKLGNLTVNSARREAYLRDDLLELTTIQFDMLWYLINNAGNVVSRNDLCRAIHNTEYNGIDRSIDIYISRIRQKLGDDPSKPYYLKTVRGVGYLFADEKF